MQKEVRIALNTNEILNPTSAKDVTASIQSSNKSTMDEHCECDCEENEPTVLPSIHDELTTANPSVNNTPKPRKSKRKIRPPSRLSYDRF